MHLQGMHIPCYNSNDTGIIKGCVALEQFLTQLYSFHKDADKLRKMKAAIV